MKIQPQEFKDSFYYIAPGKDFEPLLRFSHLCKNYFFANLYLTKEEVLDYANRFFDEHCEFIEVMHCDMYDVFDETTFFELHPSYREHLRDIKFMGSHYQGYKNAFKQAVGEPQWLIHYKLFRKGVNRELNLYYFTAEGLATYVALSHNGRYTPKVFCTIETKILERDNNIVTSLFQQLKSYPLCWIKGHEPYEYYTGGYYESNHIYNPLQPNEQYSVTATDFIFKWKAEGSFVRLEFDLKKISNRFCKGFIRQETEEKLRKLSFRNFGSNGKIIRGNIIDVVDSLNVVNEQSIVVLTRNLFHLATKLPKNIKYLYWEDIMRYYDKDNFIAKFADLGDGIEHNKYSMLKSLDRLDQYLAKDNQSISKLFFIPFGLEDESIILENWLNNKKGATQFIGVVNRTLDCCDLLEGL
jgi:hypothetical protein